MVYFKIFEHPETRRYRTQLVTKVSVFYFVITAIQVFCPLLVAYRSYGFWIREATYTEDAAISFKYRAMLVLGTTNRNYVWSTFSKYNNLQRDNFLLAAVKTKQTDSDLDGRNENLNLELSLPVPDGENVQSVELLLFFQYEMFRLMQIKFEAIAYIHQETIFPAGKLSVYGRLKFVQDQLLGYKGSLLTYQTSVVDDTSDNLDDYDINTILANYQSRNISTRFENDFYRWERQRGPGQNFVINATVIYPLPTILYRPGFWQILKWAWVQYIAVFFVFEFVLYRIKCFVFQNQILSTVVERPILSDNKQHRY